MELLRGVRAEDEEGNGSLETEAGARIAIKKFQRCLKRKRLYLKKMVKWWDLVAVIKLKYKEERERGGF